MKRSNTSVADSLDRKAEKLTSNSYSDTGKDFKKEESMLHIQQLELRIAELELQNENLSKKVESQNQKKAELQKNENLLRSIIHNIPDLIWLKDVNGLFLACNTSVERFFGAKEADIIGKTDYDFVDKKLADFFRANEQIVMTAGTPLINEELIHFANDGHNAFLETVKTPLYDMDNKLIGILGIGHDITLRKKTELQLLEKEVQYLNLANSGLALVWTAGLDKLCNYFNNSWLNFTGRTLEQEIGNGWTEGVFSEDLDKCIETYTSAFDKREAFQLEYRLLHRSGEHRWILDMGTPNYNNAGEFIGYIGNCFDIHERKQVENALKESEDKFKNVFENSIIGKSITSLDGQLQANAAFSKLVGYTEEELQKMSWREITFPKDIQYDNALVEQILSGKRDSAHREKRFIHKNGSLIWVDLSTVLQRDKNSKPLFFITEFVDITERKRAENALLESEEKLNTLFTSMTEMMAMHELVFDENGKAVNYIITDCNVAFSKITGIEKKDAVGKLATEVYGTDNAPYLKQYAQVATSGKSLVFDSYYSPMDKHFLISVIAPEKNKFATIATDVSVLQQAQQQILNKNKELEDYLYIASHDLRSPLVNIQGFSQRLQKQTNNIKSQLANCGIDPILKTNISKITTEEIPKTLDFIFSSVAKMEALINGLLQLSRTGRIKMYISKVNMNKLLEKVLFAHSFQISELSSHVHLEHLPDCYGDEQQLNQLFSNLISNAIKYRDQNKALKIKISAINDFNRIIYSVTDNGIGIEHKFQEKVWNIFYRIDPQSQIAGDGVGLSVVKQIAERHRGKAWVESVESVEGHGCTFFIELQKNNWE